MKPLNLACLFSAMLLSVSIAIANPGNGARPSFVRSDKFVVVVNNTSTSIKEVEASANSAKVCACQLMAVSSNNEKLDYVAVFAEKTNNGELNNSFSVAMKVLDNEKKQMKQLFYSKIKVVGKITAYSSCRSLALKLKTGNNDLRVYDILDADILGSRYIIKK